VTDEQVQKEARRFRRRADAYKNDPKKAEKLLKEAEAKAQRDPGRLTAVFEDFTVLMRLVRAYYRKEYREVPWNTIAFAIAAIAYFVTPVDLIPDPILGFGYIDDAALIAFVIKSAKDDIQNFRQWEALQQR